MSDEVRIIDENHIWYKGKQYISLSRFIDIKTNQLNEMEILGDEIERLNKENEAYKTILHEGGKR